MSDTVKKKKTSSKDKVSKKDGKVKKEKKVSFDGAKSGSSTPSRSTTPTTVNSSSEPSLSDSNSKQPHTPSTSNGHHLKESNHSDQHHSHVNNAGHNSNNGHHYQNDPNNSHRNGNYDPNLISFHAGQIFSQFDVDQDGKIDKREFIQFVQNHPEMFKGMNGKQYTSGYNYDPNLISFDAGQIFSQFDTDHDGKLDKQEFTQLVRKNPDLLRAFSKSKYEYAVPTELVSSRLLTHFDETAGVAIHVSEVEQHKNMGNVVTSLLDSYQIRYEKLRSLLTGKLLPKREHLLQLHRQLQNCSVEVDATRRVIERETLTDSEQILERLRSVESMRQSSIKHQILQLEEELQAIERLVRRVEHANLNEAMQSNTTGVLLTSANPIASPVLTIRGPRAANMVELIHQYSELSSNIERLAIKPVTVQVDYPTDDFPRETAERLEIIAKCDKYMHALNVKDHMLWTAIKEKEKYHDLLSEEKTLSHEYALEVANWAEMCQGLSQQLKNVKQEKEKMDRRNKELVAIMREHNLYYMPPSDES